MTDPLEAPKPPILERWTVSVIVEKRPLKSRWQPFEWRPVAVLPSAVDTAPWTLLSEEGGVGRWFVGLSDLVLFEKETQVYKHNIEMREPAVYVVLRKDASERGVDLLLATIDPGEAHAHADTGDDILEAVPMPPEIHAWMSAFVAEHHVERGFWKRKRDRADPEALAVGRPGRASVEEDDD